MCTYSITIDEQLVSQATIKLPTGVSFNLWLQQQVIELLKTQVSIPRRRTSSAEDYTTSVGKKRKLQIDARVAKMFQGTSLPEDFDEKKAYGEYLYQKYK